MRRRYKNGVEQCTYTSAIRKARSSARAAWYTESNGDKLGTATTDMSAFHLPPANQAQISRFTVFLLHEQILISSDKVRANQRDLFHVASLREQLDVLLRTSFGEFCVANK